MNVINSLKGEVEKIMNNDPAHDFEHVMRVYKNAENLDCMGNRSQFLHTE